MQFLSIFIYYSPRLIHSWQVSLRAIEHCGFSQRIVITGAIALNIFMMIHYENLQHSIHLICYLLGNMLIHDADSTAQ